MEGTNYGFDYEVLWLFLGFFLIQLIIGFNEELIGLWEMED